MQENKTYFFIPLFNISLQNTLQIYIFFHLSLLNKNTGLGIQYIKNMIHFLQAKYCLIYFIRGFYSWLNMTLAFS